MDETVGERNIVFFSISFSLGMGFLISAFLYVSGKMVSDLMQTIACDNETAHKGNDFSSPIFGTTDL